MPPTASNRRRFSFGLKSAVAALLVFWILSAYVGSYYRLSRRGMRDAERYHGICFMYVPLEAFGTSDRDTEAHYRMQDFYDPLNWIDVHLFGGMPSHNGTLRVE